MSIKLIASDMDGTLLSSAITIRKETRRPSAAPPKKESFFDCDGAHVCVGPALRGRSGPRRTLGHVQWRPCEGQPVWESLFPYAHSPRDCPGSFGVLPGKGYHIQAYVQEELLVREADSLSEEYRRLSNVPPRPVGDALYHLTDAPTKMLVMTDPEHFAPVFDDLTERFRGRLTVVSSKTNFIDLIAPGVNKWNGVKAVAALYGIGPEEIMCIGDNGNDVVMLRNAGLGVAVDNASDAAREAAKVVVPANDDDGVAKAIELALTEQAVVPE